MARSRGRRAAVVTLRPGVRLRSLDWRAVPAGYLIEDPVEASELEAVGLAGAVPTVQESEPASDASEESEPE